MDGNRVVIPLDPPADSKPGDRIFIEGFSHAEHGGKCLRNKIELANYKYFLPS